MFEGRRFDRSSIRAMTLQLRNWETRGVARRDHGDVFFNTTGRVQHTSSACGRRQPRNPGP